jgi:hypothetical protein
MFEEVRPDELKKMSLDEVEKISLDEVEKMSLDEVEKMSLDKVEKMSLDEVDGAKFFIFIFIFFSILGGKFFLKFPAKIVRDAWFVRGG